ncbi:MAG: TetR/AcrR family transcriptional regulator [Roseiflexaceae bacterium]
MSVKPFDDLGPQGRAKRAQIIEAARLLFLERGFERTSMDTLREVAGVSKATLYNHYPSKEALFSDVVRTIVDRVAGDWLPAVEDAAGGLRSRDELRQALVLLAQRALTTMMQPEYLALVRVVITDLHRFPQLGEIYRAAGPEPGMRRFAGFLERARANGLAEFTDPNAAARLFIGSILSYALMDGLLVAGEPRVPPPEQIVAVVDLFLRAITQPETPSP